MRERCQGFYGAIRSGNSRQLPIIASDLSCVLTAHVNARQRVLHIHEPTNQSVLRIWIGHFDWLVHEYAIRVDGR